MDKKQVVFNKMGRQYNLPRPTHNQEYTQTQGHKYRGKDFEVSHLYLQEHPGKKSGIRSLNSYLTAMDLKSGPCCH